MLYFVQHFFCIVNSFMMKMILSLCLLCSIIGCKNDTIHDNTQDNFTISGTNSAVKAIVVGVENGWAGPCPGSLLDTKTMTSMLQQANVTDITCMTDSNATVNNVINAFKSALDSELIIFYYSGHGGSQPKQNMNDAFEVDGNDEYLCLYDSGLLDDDIWKLVTMAKGKVFLIFDCCHSETMFRQPGLKLNKTKISSNIMSARSSISMLCWSGCPDNTYSYGSSKGGQFTNAIKRYFKPNMTYDELWNKVVTDDVLRSYQICRMTKIGLDFGSSIIFK